MSFQQSLFPASPAAPGEARPLTAVTPPRAASPAVERLWLAVLLPSLALDIRFRGRPRPLPQAVIETRGQQAQLLACDAAAAAAGVQPGISLAAAWALCPELEIHEREPRREQAMLRRLAAWCGRFTPVVTLEDGMLLLEIRGSQRLFGGAQRLRQLLQQGLRELGFESRSAVAPTPRAAAWFARAGSDQCLLDAAALAASLGQLPLAATGFSARLQQRFAGIGARRVADLLRLPRAGFARRFGPGSLAVLDQALGREPDLREALQPPPQFSAELELLYEIESAPVLLHPAGFLLRELEGYLHATGQGVLRWRLELQDRDRGRSSLLLAHAEPTRELARLQRLLEQRLETAELPAPVIQLRLVVVEMRASEGQVGGLFRDTGTAAEPTELLERLRTRLGEDAVLAPATLPDYRPERALRASEPGAVGPVEAAAAPRPLWLLEPPRPLRVQQQRPRGYELLEGPERIETGWWDGADVRRDYWQARDREGRRAWLFREQRTGDWWLQGYFD